MSKVMTRSIRMPAGMLALALLATACQKHEAPPPEAPDNNAAETPPPPPPPMPAPEPPQPVAAPPKPKVVEAVPAPEVPADQQVIDDADATGMTSRASRNAAADGND